MVRGGGPCLDGLHPSPSVCPDAAAVTPLPLASHIALAKERLRELKTRWIRWVLHHSASHFSLINSTYPFAARSPVPHSVPSVSSMPGTTRPLLHGKQPGYFAPHCYGRVEAVWFYTSTDELSSSLFQMQTQTQWNVFHFWTIFLCCFYESIVFCDSSVV